MFRLGDLLADLSVELGYKYSVTAAGVVTTKISDARLNLMLRKINTAYEEVCRLMPKGFLTRKRVIPFVAAYTTGTINISAAATTVTGTGTAFAPRMQGRQILPYGERRIYFIRSYTSGTIMTLAEAHPIAVSAATYTIGQWAIPLPSDFLAPIPKDGVFDVTNNYELQLIEPNRFRKYYETSYLTGKATFCCIDGVTTFPMLDYGTLTVVKDSATITHSAVSVIKEDDIGKYITIEGDSILYKIVSAIPDAGTFTVSPAVQRASAGSLTYAMERHPLPLLWLDYAPSSATVLQLTYKAKPQTLWTPNQVIELAGDYKTLFEALVRFRLLSAFSSDAQHKQEALLELQSVAKSMPQYLDTADICRDTGISEIEFPNVREGT